MILIITYIGILHVQGEVNVEYVADAAAMENAMVVQEMFWRSAASPRG